jgi:carbon storage regulator CsrA
MLVITRKDQEGLVILDESGQTLAVIKAVKSTYGKTKLGIDAPSYIKVLREELLEDRIPTTFKE